MDLTKITVTGTQAVELLIGSFGLYKKGFRTHEEHLETCRVLRELFGEEVYGNVISQEAIKQAMKIYPEAN